MDKHGDPGSDMLKWQYPGSKSQCLEESQPAEHNTHFGFSMTFEPYVF